MRHAGTAVVDSPAQRERRRASAILLSLGGGVLLSLLFACAVGSVTLPLPDLFAAIGETLRGESASLGATLLGLRIGRALVAFVTGASLALAGVMMQALPRNPLADPYVLGVSGGASVGALAALLFGGALWMVDAAALAGAVAVSLI